MEITSISATIPIECLSIVYSFLKIQCSSYKHCLCRLFWLCVSAYGSQASQWHGCQFWQRDMPSCSAACQLRCSRSWLPSISCSSSFVPSLVSLHASCQTTTTNPGSSSSPWQLPASSGWCSSRPTLQHSMPITRQLYLPLVWFWTASLHCFVSLSPNSMQPSLLMKGK